METKRFTRKFKVMGVFMGVLGLAVIALGITSALDCLAGVGLIALGVYFFVDDWDKVLAD